MKNEFYNFDTKDYDGYIVRDFAFQTKSSNILDLSESYDTAYVMYIQFEENQTFEMVSYILYGTTDYWDLLVALNDKNPLYDLFFSDDIIVNYGETMTALYEERVSEQQLPTSTRNMLLDRYKNYGYSINDENKIIKIIKPLVLGDYLKVLRDNKII